MNERADELSVLFVCLGNICRSPTAEAVFRRKVEEAGLADRVEIDSAGTGSWHVGQAPDARAQEAAARRGLDLSSLRGRQVARKDLDDFDYVLVMDEQNRQELEGMAPGKAERFLSYAPAAQEIDIPDPYHGGEGGFERVLDLIEAASDGLLEDVRRRLA